ncbi:Mu1-adaptin [Scenedesmus sp. NREL 46B-D3]|nr:Mu1-adaptin [Scenedesmus sp. NREL 46B-D3]
MSVSAIFILDVKGRVLIHRDYRGDVSTKFADKFMSKLNESEDSGKLSPVLHDDGVTYIYLQHSNVYLLAVTRQNVNATAVMVFLHRLVDVFKHYFEEVEEESVRDNFVTVYELMDEQTAVKPPMAVTNAVSWRSEGIRHKKNEVFLDVVESVNLLVNSNGNVVLSEVAGVLKMRTYLSGMPECKLGLNDKKAVDLEDIKFHQCVRLARFDNDRTISFIPPDGAFDLMTYRLSQNIKPLIWVECLVERPSRSRTDYVVKARSQFKERSVATNVEIILPLPSDATTPVTRCSQGSAVYAPEKSALVWQMRNFPGGKEYMLRCHFNLPSVEAEEERHSKMPPIKVKFEIPYFTVSGMQVRYLKVIEKSGYQALPWVRYITTAGNYEIRMN